MLKHYNQAAKSLYIGVERITIAELADPAIISGPVFTTIINGILIARFGSDVFHLANQRNERGIHQ